MTWCLLSCTTLISAAQLPVNDAWKFKFDLTDAGKGAGWEKPAMDDSGWQSVQAGKPWTSFGYFGYSGVAWYRKRVAIPPEFQGKFILFRGVEEQCTVYLDGAEAGSYRRSPDPKLQGVFSGIPPFRLRLPRAPSVLVAVRVVGRDNHATHAAGPGLVEGVWLSDETLVSHHGYWLAPDHYVSHDQWLAAMREERARRRTKLGNDRHIYTGPYAWTSRNFVEAFAFVYDTRFYNYRENRYRLDEYLDEGEKRFGGYDSLLLWHAYPNLGVDDQNQFDMLRNMPGGLPGLRNIIDRARRRGVRTYIAYNPWDRNTTQEKRSHAESLAAMAREISADGIFLDVTDNLPQETLRAAVDAQRDGVALEPEGGLNGDDGIATLNASWAQGYPAATFLDHARGVPIAKWTEPRHMIHYDGDRWRHDRSVMFQHAFLNGAGIVLWENIFGSWNRYTERDQAILRRMLPIERMFSDLLATDSWEPFYPTLLPDVDASYWPGRSERLWTIVNWSTLKQSGSILRVRHVSGERYFDLWNGTEINPQLSASDAVLNVSKIEPHGFAAILAIKGAPDSTLSELLRNQRAKAAKDLTVFREEWPVPAPPVLMLSVKTAFATAPAPPDDMALIPAVDQFKLSIVHNLGEGGCYPDDERHDWNRRSHYMYEEGNHQRNVLHQIRVPGIPAYLIDRYPVTRAQYKVFLDRSGYRPADGTNFLRDWDWTNPNSPKPPAALEDHPVTWVDLDDARAYGSWAGKRLPTEEEWQYAAGGKEQLRYPWGNLFRQGVANDRRGATTPVRAFPGGRSPFGVYDMSGNVWEWTESERDDGNRYTLLRGGSFYQADGSAWYFDRYIRAGLGMGEWSARPVNYHAKMFLMSPGMDRKGTIGFRCVKDIRQ